MALRHRVASETHTVVLGSLGDAEADRVDEPSTRPERMLLRFWRHSAVVEDHSCVTIKKAAMPSLHRCDEYETSLKLECEAGGRE
jgi:hypothetical protein